jgi:hypothetical protein
VSPVQQQYADKIFFDCIKKEKKLKVELSFSLVDASQK